MNTNIKLLLLVFLLSACGNKEEKKVIPVAPADQLVVDFVAGVASIEPEDRIVQLTTESAGIVEIIHVKVSQEVSKGDLLFTLSDDVEAAQISQAQSKINTQKSIIESQQATVRSLEVQVQNAQLNYDRTQKLFDGHAATQQQLDDSKFTFDNIMQQKMATQANLNEQIAKQGEQKADLDYYIALFERKHIRAPVTGTILSIEAKVGNYVNSATILGDFAPEGDLVAITEIDELFADRIKVGARAKLRPQGDSILLGQGEVYIVSPYLKKKSLFSDNAGSLEDRRVREVRVKIDPGAKVLIGSRVECVIELK